MLPGPARPVTFAGLMTLYESNYVRLKWLLPELPGQDTCRVSTSSADMALYLRVVEVCPYTTTLWLSYLFQDGPQLVADPDLFVRVYHDARMVEAMACTDRHRHRALREFATGEGSELERRWVRNIMLNKWLEYCADHGHQFKHRSTCV